ncbi:MAG: carbamoyltransferase HypF, partial [Bacteroidota bacterium]|nr:carbamoyltransferase HypF [Bacteroidota bacterium]
MQGVGFRPFVYGLAKKYELTGWVANGVDGVHIEFNACEVVSSSFYKELLATAPKLAHIAEHSKTERSFIWYKDFKIITSGSKGSPVLLLSPDYAICEECQKEIMDDANRRHRYAFTTCTQCGPRYSIIKQLPYDREHTAMSSFTMCNACTEEYNNPLDRRHYSQTNSCPGCAIKMKLYNNKQTVIEEDQEKIIRRICDLWSQGKIVAIKGIGGYLLTCDATNKTVISELRRRKHRPKKPLALMFPDMRLLQHEVHINKCEEDELKSSVYPIILLRLKKSRGRSFAINEIAPQLSTIGAMLPYTPLYQLLLQQFAKPVVATSANISNAPIVFKDDAAMNELNAIADYVLVHNREIITPQDDSVVTYNRYSQQKIVLRRSRGVAPFYIHQNLLGSQTTVLALGALLKSSFSLLHQQNIHLSQYLGDTDNYDAQMSFEKTVHQFLKLYQAKPEVILIDKHPDYFTTKLGEQMARQWNSDIVKVQHHEAHFASVLGEHNLIDETGRILGVIRDGTGFGNDGQIWGGEFFIYSHHNYLRTDHFDYFDSFLGDKMAVEPRLSAYSLCHNFEEAATIIQPKFTATQWNNYQKIIATNRLKTSSVGRLFDAVASLLGLIDKATYEGEGAMLLE